MNHYVRNVFKILGYHQRERTQLRSQQARQNLLPQKGAPQTNSKHTGQEVHSSFIFNVMLPLPWIRQVLGSQSKWLANWKVDIGRLLWRQWSLKVQGSNNSFWWSVLEPGHLVEFCLTDDNNPLFLIETFNRLSKVYEANVWEAS
jgi:hypothetical protein